MRWTVTLAIVLLATNASAAETIYVDSPLSAMPTGAGGTVVGNKGGTFSASGWTTTGEDDALWFLIPATLPTVRIEVNVKGISNAALDGEEHDLIVTYGDSDRPEPVEYMPAYRNNGFKTNLRIFGSTSEAAGGRPVGANKLELALCTAGAPGYYDMCPCTSGAFFEVGYLGTVGTIPWDPATNYRFKINWSPGVISYTRSGSEAPVTIKYPGTIAPKNLRVRIGSPRHGVGSPNHMPKGLTFSNLVIAGEPGAATPVCATGATDAGAACMLRADPMTMVGTIARVPYYHCGSPRVAQFWVGDAVDPALPNLSGGFDATTSKLFVGDQTCDIGEAKKLTTPDGSLDCSRTKLLIEGTKVTFDWALELNPATLGSKPRGFFVDAKGGVPETRLGWTRVGTYGSGPVDDAGVITTPDAAVDGEDPWVAADAGNGTKGRLQSEDLGGGELACQCGAAGRNANAHGVWALLLLLVRRRRR
jgi:hypothetical protein